MFCQTIAVRAWQSPDVPVCMSFVYQFCWDAHVSGGAQALLPKMIENNIAECLMYLSLSFALSLSASFLVKKMKAQCVYTFSVFIRPVPFLTVAINQVEHGESLCTHGLHRFFPYSLQLRLQHAISYQQRESKLSVCSFCIQVKKPCLLFIQLIAESVKTD